MGDRRAIATTHRTFRQQGYTQLCDLGQVLPGISTCWCSEIGSRPSAPIWSKNTILLASRTTV
jgi:hypothetical protein